MTTITFWEKPGCGGNLKQKAVLRAAGHTVVPRNLLTEPWTRSRLLAFFGDRPVAHWFNRAAPDVKNFYVGAGFNAFGIASGGGAGWVLAEWAARGEAPMDLWVQHNPILIRRPLMQAGDGSRMVGFVLAEVDAWVGLDAAPPVEGDPEACVQGGGGRRCADPDHRGSDAGTHP